MATTIAEIVEVIGFPFNVAPSKMQLQGSLPAGFLRWLEPLHRRFAPRQQQLLEQRAATLAAALDGQQPTHRFPADSVRDEWKVELPSWCADQRNQMTGPADDAQLVVKMMNSGAPGVMLDLEDSIVNDWEHQEIGATNILAALRGDLTYFDSKRGATVGMQPNNTIVWIRPRGLHIHQAGLFDDLTPASLFDVARIAYQVSPVDLKHPLCFYIPKSESAEEALWWRDVFQAIAEVRGWPKNYIRCMALVESHPLAFEVEEFLYNLRDHIVGLNLGRWDYMASLIHFNLNDPEWMLPDRNTIPHDVPFFQNLRELLPEICHKRGVLAIGGMTALYPSREDAELNARALTALAMDKRNEADCYMDGAWTGHPDQNDIALEQFPVPNQLAARRANAERYPNLRPKPRGVGHRSLAGTRAAVRTVIRYRNGVLNGKGASLLDGYMEDLATDRIYRLMIAQRMKHHWERPIHDENGEPVAHTQRLISRLFDEELEKLSANPGKDLGTPQTFREARRISEAMILNGEFNPI